MRSIAVILGVAMALLAGPGRAAEPRHELSAKVAFKPVTHWGSLVRTSQGLGWAGPWGLQALEGGEDIDLGEGRGVLVAAPRWILAADEAGHGGYFDPQMRGRIVVRSLDPARRITGRPAKAVQAVGWPLSATEQAGGRLGVVLWTKGLPLVQGRGHRMVLWSPTEGVVASQDWRIGSMGDATLSARPDGSWRMLSLLDSHGKAGEACGKGVDGVVLTTIGADLKIVRRQYLCLPSKLGRVSIEAGAHGDWFVSARDSWSIRLFQVTEGPAGPSLKALLGTTGGRGGFYRPPFAVAADGTVYLARDRIDGWSLYRVAPDGAADEFALTHAGCDGPPGKNAILHLDTIDGVAHATLAAREPDGTCLNIWRL
ncbi:hypothetical protein GVN21_13525 [Caulobacter sp. SLTY]|uniref:hypothetical protein n=1 Tax=Caulobacter sp. SLTY TaxID=2683262 RepID=UPI001412BB67|nr:hypothetical protein [Caulobacter sp. SLTY]NBB16380.1 hypothetical protein [Caulobacter sp. SLTY]